MSPPRSRNQTAGFDVSWAPNLPLHPLGIRSQHLLGGAVGTFVVGDGVGDVGDEVGDGVGGAAKKFVGAEVGDGTAVGLAVGATPDVTFVYNVWFRSESIRCCTLASSCDSERVSTNNRVSVKTLRQSSVIHAKQVSNTR